MATLKHNITGELKTAILSPGDNTNIKSISIANTHATLGTHVDLYIGTYSEDGVAAISYYLNKGYLLNKGETLTYSDFISFDNSNTGFALFVKLTGVGTTSPTVDIIISP